MPISTNHYSHYSIPFTLDMVFKNPKDIETSFCVLLKQLASFFTSLSLRSCEIKSITHSSHLYRLENGIFECQGPYAENLDNNISLRHHGPNPILWKGNLIFMENSQQEINALMQGISAFFILHPDLRFGFIWRFSDDLSKNFESLIGVCATDKKRHFADLHVSSFAFGNIVNGNHFLAHFTSDLNEGQSKAMNTSPIKEMFCNLKHSHKYMELQFPGSFHHPGLYGTYRLKLRYDYNSIKEVTVSMKKKNVMALYFHLSRPPKILTDKKLLDPDLVYPDADINNAHSKHRYIRWHNGHSIPSDIIGKSNVLKLVIKSSRGDCFQLPLPSLYSWRRFNHLDINYAPIIETVYNRYVENANIDNLPFEIRYGIECIRSLSYSFHDDLGNEGTSKLIEFIKCQIGKTKQVAETLYRLFADYQISKIYHALEHFKWRFRQVLKNWETACNFGNDSNLHIKYLRRCILTPTRVLLLPPCPFQSSFFLEVADPEYTIRAIIRDEDFSSLGYAVAGGADECSDETHLKDRDLEIFLPDCRRYFLKKVIENRLISEGGLDVAGRRYQYYGASSSQFRDAGMILYATDSSSRSAQTLRNSFGVIDAKSVAKYSSRIGLSLSQVISFVELPPNTKIALSPDIYGGRHTKSKEPYNFTDGCGSISFLLARHIWNQMIEQKVINATHSNDLVPSAFQIRFMGAKGMVCIDKKLDGMTIVLRESMIKMRGSKGRLGILKFSEPRRAYLNSPFITILNQKSLPNEFFVNLLMETLRKLIASFDSNSCAISALKMFSSLHRFIDYEKLASAGFKLHDDPFFRSILSLTFNQGIDVIKRKARIPLPLDRARTMFGIADPTVNPYCPTKEVKFTEKNVCIPPEIEPCFDALGKGLLKRGEVFVWPSDFDKPCVGELIVTKFPSTHPGDVRRLVAKDHRELHLIRDCIVFPVDGNRPHSDEMAGSDLDGDEYCVIWANEFKRFQISEPMEYPSSSGGENFDNITDKEMIQFHIQYLQECDIGRIAKAHLAWADLSGIDSSKCVELAVKYAGALDVAKKGIEDQYRFHERDKYHEAPDFMEKHSSKPGYHSQRALGAIYQIISQFQLFLADEVKVKQVIEPHVDMRLEHPQWQRYEESARAAYSKYEAIVEHLLQRCDFSSESELLSQIHEKNNIFRQSPEEGARSNDHEDSVVSIVKNVLIKKMEEDFDYEFTAFSAQDLAQARMAKASAFYMVTLKKAKASKLKCFGLPWIGNYSQYLVNLLFDNMHMKASKPLITKNRHPGKNMGFTGDDDDKAKSCEKTRQKLDDWFSLFCDVTDVSDKERDKLRNQLNHIFSYATKLYLSGDRLRDCSGRVILKIFDHVQEYNRIDIKASKTKRLFVDYNNPMGQLVIALLEQELSNCLIKTKDSSSDLFTNRLFMVNNPVKRNKRTKATIYRLIHLLSCIIPEAEISDASNESDDYIPMIVYASPASLLIAQIAVGVHNRLFSIHCK